MRVPIRKAGNLPSISIDYQITQEKYQELIDKLNHLKKFVHPQLSKEVQRLAELGDFSENVEYQLAKGKLRGLNQKIELLEKQINRAVIIENTGNNQTVKLGHTVTVKLNNREFTYRILGSTETNPGQGIISQHSPIGQALLGKKVNDQVIVQLPDRQLIYQILEIK